MKKAEAISILATSVRPREPKDRARYDEAVRMAIEALKRSETPNSSDCIDRQAAIETAIEAADKWDGGYSPEREGIIRKFFDKVPAVQPATSCSEIPNDSDDTISRQAALDAITDELMPSTPLSAVIRAKNRLKDLPPIQPDHVADISKKAEKEDCISRQAAIDAIEKCYTCKHVYQRVSDADTLYCRCRKGCRYEEFKPKRSTGNPQWHEGENQNSQSRSNAE